MDLKRVQHEHTKTIQNCANCSEDLQEPHLTIEIHCLSALHPRNLPFARASSASQPRKYHSGVAPTCAEISAFSRTRWCCNHCPGKLTESRGLPSIHWSAGVCLVLGDLLSQKDYPGRLWCYHMCSDVPLSSLAYTGYLWKRPHLCQFPPPPCDCLWRF